MKTAYLYVRVSTDEQKRKGYSLPEQEDRLHRYCEAHNIEVKGIYREDYSAKTFKRPEWNNLLSTLKKNKNRPPEKILFLKWDRFSRNIELAYQMIGILRSLNTQAMAIDQPIDFSIPESTVTLAIYLSIPDAENGRRALNTSNCMRRAKLAGRWPGKAPKGYQNLTTYDGKKYIAPKAAESDLIAWSFKQLAKGTIPADQVRKMACKMGLQCSSSNFWKLIRNPIYCGLIAVPAYQDEQKQFVKAIHQPLISETLFYEVQYILTGNQRQRGVKELGNIFFPLRGFLNCPLCHRKLTGSISKGKYSHYPYYHCAGSICKARFKAETLNKAYEEELKKLKFIPEVHELFRLVLEDNNIFSKKEYDRERKLLISQISEQETVMSQARRLFVKGKLESEDFNEIKRDYNNVSAVLNTQLNKLNLKSAKATQSIVSSVFESNLYDYYVIQEISDKRKLINLITPSTPNLQNLILAPLKMSEALSKIITTVV
jgi:site-specific DNA recombinase